MKKSREEREVSPKGGLTAMASSMFSFPKSRYPGSSILARYSNAVETRKKLTSTRKNNGWIDNSNSWESESKVGFRKNPR